MGIEFDPNKPYTEVGGRDPLRYMQFGLGFNSAYQYIGKFGPNGEPYGAAKALYAEENHEPDEPQAPVARARGRPRRAA